MQGKLVIIAVFIIQLIAVSLCSYPGIRSSMKQQCVPLEIQQCRKVGYNLTRPVDLYSPAGRNFNNGKKFIELMDLTPCSKFALFFLCSVYSPLCLKGHKEAIPPCKTVCYIVKDRCSPMMKLYGIDWPEELNCDHLPEHNSGFCIQPSSFLIAKKGRRVIKDSSSTNHVACVECKKHTHNHAKFRHYRKSDYVIEASIMSRATTANGRTKVYVNITRIIKEGSVKPKLGKMKLWAPTRCLCPHIEFDERYIIMGSEQTKNKQRLLFDQYTHILPYKGGQQKIKKWHEKCKKKGCNKNKKTGKNE